MSEVIQKPARLARILKGIGITFLGLILLISLALISALVWLNSGSGRAYVEQRVEALSIAGQTMEIEGLNGSVLSAFSIDHLSVSGRDGVWLEAKNVSVDWVPRALLSQTVQIERLDVGDVDILQRPIWIPGDESGSDSPVSALRLKAVSFPDIGVSEAVTGRAIQAQTSGTLSHSSSGGQAELFIRSDQGDRVDADLAWSPLFILTGQAEVEGPPGGLLANLLQLNPDQTVALDIESTETETDILARIDRIDLADLTLQRSQSTVSLDGSVQPETLPLLNRLTPWLGGATDISAILPLDESARAQIDLSAPRLNLAAIGEKRGEIISLTRFRLSSRNPLQPLSQDSLSIDQIVAEGEVRLGDDYRFEGQVEVVNLAYNQYQLDRLSGPTILSFADGRLVFDTALDGQARSGPASQANGSKLISTGQMDLSGRFIDFTKADIRLPGLSVNGRASVGYGENRSAEFAGQYRVDTALFRDGPSAKLSGQATIRQTASGPVAEITGQAGDFRNLPDFVVPLTDDNLRYEARLRSRNGVINIPTLTLQNDRMKIEGSAGWQDHQITADLDYQAPQYGYAALSTEAIDGEITLSGPPDTLSFRTQSKFERLDAGSLSLTDANLSAEGVISGSSVTMTTSLEGESVQGPIVSQGDVALDGSDWSVDNLTGSLGDLGVTGQLSGVGGDLATLRGALNLSGRSPLIPAEAVTGQIRLGEARVDLDMELAELAYGPLQNGTLKLTAQGPRERISFTLNLDGTTIIQELERPVKVSATGVSDFSLSSLPTEADFKTSLSDLAFVGALNLSRPESGWAGRLDGSGLSGKITAQLAPEEPDIFSFEVQDVSVPKLAALLARPATEGRVTGRGAFRQIDSRVEGQASLSFNDLRSPISEAEAISIRTDLTLQNDYLTIRAGALEGRLSGQATLEGAVKTRIQAPFVIYPPVSPFQGQAKLNGEIGPVLELFLPPQTDVAGRIDTDLQFTVPQTPTGVQGQIRLTQGVFEQGALGLNLTDIALEANLAGDQITVPTLSAKGKDGGTLSGSGRMGLGEGTGTVDIRANKLKILDRREGQAEVTGELALSRTAELLRLSGELRVTDADVNIARLPKPGLPTLDVNFGDPDEEEEVRSFASAATELDIQIVSNGRIKVRGRGLNASMNLDSSVTGPFDAPIITGRMSIDRGRFDFLSKRFEFQDSFVDLREDVLQSRLSLLAVRETSDLTATVQIAGTLERPEITLTSEPQLPEDEVLSRILFGRSPTQLSAIETARLAAALTQLSGGSGFDLFGSLENAIGLDTLEIGQTESGQTELTTGKYLSDDVYLEVRSAAQGTPGIAVEWQIRNNVSVEAETLPEERQRLSVQWKRDFD